MSGRRNEMISLTFVDLPRRTCSGSHIQVVQQTKGGISIDLSHPLESAYTAVTQCFTSALVKRRDSHAEFTASDHAQQDPLLPAPIQFLTYSPAACWLVVRCHRMAKLSRGGTVTLYR